MVERYNVALDHVFHALAIPRGERSSASWASGERTVSEIAEPLPNVAGCRFEAHQGSRTVWARPALGALAHSHVQPQCPAARCGAEWLIFYEEFWNERFDALDELFRAKKKKKK